MGVLDLIKSRRSIGVVDERDVPDEVIHTLLEAATWAPNHKKTEPWKFRVIKGEGRAKLGEEMGRIMKLKTADLSEEEAAKKVEKAAKGPLRAPVIIAVCVSPSGKVPEVEEVVAAGCALQNLLLTATEKGLATICRTGDIVYQPELKQYLQLEENDQIIGLVYVGYPKKELDIKAQRTPIEEKTIWYQ
ncbi:nitroreductase family protein [Heyndrickxia ginsengihumi]|uniref:Putative NAD(P)H nitroreductase n=1 Tax=Heyndrickxia ginsengihumi TaxID=363870 RepID=A0A0A6VE68_9BACI|nr:nitroreductase [Heyndrickxia ginsengihumi]KHD86580.1 nitroreductase [Heyndrickxia ginsengihumi]MBE6183062.1 nitroreductase [Bacillus sp. (in: firmicutes)]MCM3022610.1 nitroreductase [Heyndrickxia ginsengihumi]NEY19054.1 nitroreductase [Heyndrickxia ginsengihumi]